MQKNLGAAIKLNIKIGNQTMPTPAIQQQEKINQQQQQAKQSISLDKNIQNLMASFDGVLQEDSIKSTQTDSNK